MASDLQRSPSALTLSSWLAGPLRRRTPWILFAILVLLLGGGCSDHPQLVVPSCSLAGCPGSQMCVDDVCIDATCHDSAKNGSESDVDCGGSCEHCPIGKDCQAGTDCGSGACGAGTCI